MCFIRYEDFAVIEIQINSKRYMLLETIMNMKKCELNSFPCIDVEYARFNKICSKELQDALTAESIINDGDFCVHVPLAAELTLDFLDLMRCEV